jgi:chromosome segregation ATPase
MSEHNYFELAARDAITKNPEMFSLVGLDEKIAHTIARSQAEASINAAAKAEKDVAGLELEREYNQLRLKLYQLQDECRGCENHVNEAAQGIKNTEKQLRTLNVMLATAVEMNNPLQEKAVKHLINKTEGELADWKDKHHLASRYNKKAVKQLREFDKSRIDDLRRQIEEKHKRNGGKDAPKP